MRDQDDDVSTAAKVLRGLDVVLSELRQIDEVWLSEPRDMINTSIIHEARRRTRRLKDGAESFFQWVADTRLAPPPN